MKNLLLFAFVSVLLVGGCGSEKEIDYGYEDTFGVWADAESEMVRTGRFSLLFEKKEQQLAAELTAFSHTPDSVYYTTRGGAIFDNRTQTVFFSARDFLTGDSLLVDYDSLNLIALDAVACRLEKKDGRLFLKAGDRVVEEYDPVADRLFISDADGTRRTLTRGEKLAMSEPYDLPAATVDNVGECLQRWQLGTLVENRSGDLVTGITVNTNRHTYIFYFNDNILYCRAARIRHDNHGSLFAQNIRMMYNNREFTAKMHDNNLAESAAELNIIDSLFDPKICIFADTGIYWSVKNIEPDLITLNGCGQDYFIERPGRDDAERLEWFEYAGY